MAKRTSAAVFTFTKYEERLIERIDKDSARRREFVLRTTEALKFTTCSIITRKRGQRCRKRLMN